MIKKDLTIINKLGLHARAAAKLVFVAAKYSSHIKIRHRDKEVNAKSILNVMMLAATQNTKLQFIIEGDDEKEACAAIEKLIQNRFGEEE